ncbi:MFS transporter [Terriglobus roseus]|uniref:MFS transporter, ACS family, glucarate transporter n=1 Tax=Terriglobus roseus TaxID=392734 RepID=A0A1H4P264_9BACT|nr:MFS transporter [Terriglobus roseus]SEC01483.1 MFS transporter, ACS family, glucarate transporter [Terriglobus roseus]
MPIAKQTRVRYLIVFMLFVASSFSYGDRVVLSIVGLALSKQMHLDPSRLGWLLSAFSWAYVVAQLPAGGLLDRYGSKRVYGYSIIGWSICGLLAGFTGYLPAAIAFGALFFIRLLSGTVQAPIFPGNGRIVAAWFPAAERGRASAIFNSSQYFALVFFGPLMGWTVTHFNWQTCFWLGGLMSLALSAAWFRTVYSVKEHPSISQSEISHIEMGGGLAGMDYGAARKNPSTLTWAAVKLLLSSRMLVGIYLGQYCITALTWFFLTWFPIYLSQARHMSMLKVGFAASLPALCGVVGGILGGVVSDKLLRRTGNLSVARKTPIVLGMLCSLTMIGCNYTDNTTIVIALMALAFFGKGFGALGWTVIADAAPRSMTGLTGSLFNLFGNTAGILTPIIIGYIVKRTGSFNLALVYVGFMALCAIISYLFIVGDIHRVEFTPEQIEGRA